MDKKKRMGEVLVELGLIDEYRLRHALEVGKKKKSKLGETLIRLGYIGEDQVLAILKSLTGVPVLNMTEDYIKKDVQLMLPLERMREMNVVPLEIKNSVAVVAFADPLNYVIVENVKFLINNDVTAVMASQLQIEDILDHLEREGLGKKMLKLSDVRRSISNMTINDMSVANILRLLDEPDCTDLHIAIGIAPAVRTRGVFKRCNMPIIAKDIMDKIIAEIVSMEQLEELKIKKEIEYTYVRPGLGRYRINIYHQKGGELTISAKKLVEDVPSLSTLGIPEKLISLLEKKGLLLISSARGQGKDTTIAALVDYINSSSSCNIITFEDPIEYIHHHKMSNVNQRELGRDTSKDYSEVFDHVMKHDADVLVISNVRDKSMIETAIQAAQKGILVIIGVNSVDVLSAIEQVISTVSDEYMKALFSRSLIAAFSQRLVWSKKIKKRIMMWEYILPTARIQKFIRDDKVYYIKGQAPSLRDEYFPIEDSFAQAVKDGRLDQESIQAESWINQDLIKAYLER